MRIESDLPADQMANELVKAWKQYRLDQGHATEHHWLALGGRKDTEGSPGSPLVAGSWGCLLYTSPSPRDVEESRMPSSA